MRLPWIQLSADGKRRAKSFGIMVGIGPLAGVGFVSDLWEAALDLAPDGDFSGRFEDPEVLVSHAGGVPPGTRADPGGVVLYLQRVGLVSTTPFLRVRGLDRYRSTWKKNTKPSGNTDPPPRNPERVTPEPGAQDVDVDVDLKEGKPPRTRQMSDRLCSVFKEKRGSAYKFSGTKDGPALARLLKACDDDDEIIRRWGLGLTSTGWLQTNTIAQLDSKWNDLSVNGQSKANGSHPKMEHL